MVDLETDAQAALKARIRDLEAALGQNDPNLAREFDLPQSLSNLLGLLMNVTVASAEMIQQRLMITSDARVAIHRLRNALKPHDIEIVGRRGLGYWLTDSDKARIKERVTSRVTSTVGDESVATVPEAA